MYEIFYHRLVLAKDLRKIPADHQKKIFKTIHKKLTSNPLEFGKPLLGELKNYYRLRIDPYRVIYRIESRKIIVFILHVGLRKDFSVYIESARRLGLM